MAPAFLTDSMTFGRLALDELQRRGIEQAGRVGAVVDGAAWCQSFIDLHYPEAVRILDFPHAAEYVQTIGVSTRQDAATIAQMRHDLKHQGARAVLPTLRLERSRVGDPRLQGLAAVRAGWLLLGGAICPGRGRTGQGEVFQHARPHPVQPGIEFVLYLT